MNPNEPHLPGPSKVDQQQPEGTTVVPQGAEPVGAPKAANEREPSESPAEPLQPLKPPSQSQPEKQPEVRLPSMPSPLSIARDLFLVIAVFLYFIGFVYYYDFLNAFGTALSFSDVPTYQLFVYSYDVFKSDSRFFLGSASKIVILATIPILWSLIVQYGFSMLVIIPRAIEALRGPRDERFHPWDEASYKRPSRSVLKILEQPRTIMQIVGFTSVVSGTISLVVALTWIVVVRGLIVDGFTISRIAACESADAIRGDAPSSDAVVAHFTWKKGDVLPYGFVEADKASALRVLTEWGDTYHVVVSRVASPLPIAAGTLYTIPKRSVLGYRTIVVQAGHVSPVARTTEIDKCSQASKNV